jgi:hypothetical protein
MRTEHYIHTILCTTLSALFCALLAGCASTAVTTPNTPRTPQPPAPISGRTVPDTMAAEAAVETVKHFNILVKASGNGPVESIRQSVEGRLVENGDKINSDAPDVTVTLNVRATEFDRSGNYLRYEGTVDTSVVRNWDNKRLGFEPVSARGKRGLGEDEAMRNLTAQLSEASAAFVQRAARPEQSGLAVQDVTIKRPIMSSGSPEYAQQFISAVRAQRGVIYCAMVAHDYENRVLTFRVVYLADAMPEGLLNRLSTEKSLQLKPRN